MSAAPVSPGVLAGQWALLLFGALQRAGVRDVVVSPGSRSTPFAWGAWHTRGLALHPVVDERSAAFFALGLARAGGRPAVLLCTSGSAAANYYPAVVEAALARVPLLIVTADRPLDVQHADAPQTIDQLKLYGDHVRRFFDLEPPNVDPGALAALPRIAAQACLLATDPEPGPVHLNCRARKPLEPAAPATEADLQLAAAVARLLEAGVVRAAPYERRPDVGALEALASRLASARRAVVACGPVPVNAGAALRGAIDALCRAGSLPLFAEATSQLRFGTSAAGSADAFGWLIGAGAPDDLVPDLVLRVGAPLTSAAVDGLFARARPPGLHLLAEHGLPDPLSCAQSVVLGPLAASVQALAGLLQARGENRAQREYRQRIERASARVWQACAAELAGEAELIEPQAVRLAVAALPPGAQLMVGNSLPLREVDACVPAHARAVHVLHQRGANGIDGLVSGAAGAAVAAGAPTLLLLGDVSLAHDLGGLSLLRRVQVPLALVVLDNAGGRIFEQLPVSGLFESDPGFERLFVTPPELALEHAGPLFGLAYVAPRSAVELDAALREALSVPRATLVHVRVPPHSARLFRERMRRRVDGLSRGACA